MTPPSLRGARVGYIGASLDQVRWGGCNDPRAVLDVGATYTVEDAAEHGWHTKIKLVGIDGWFNSVSFQRVPEPTALATPTPGEGAGDVTRLQGLLAKLDLPWDENCLAAGIRHLARNVDCFTEGDHRCPGRYDGPAIVAIMNAAPALLARLAAVERQISETAAVAFERARERDAALAEVAEQRRVAACWEANATQWAADYDALWRRHEAARAEVVRLRADDERKTIADEACAQAAEAEIARLKAALEPFASGVDWGTVKAWIVAGAEISAGDRELGVKTAAQITRWQVAADAALAPDGRA